MTFKRLFNYLKPYKKSIFTVITIVSISSLCTIFIPKLTGDVISSLYESISSNTVFNYKHLYILISLIASFYLINSLATYLENYIMSNISEKALNKLKNDTYEKLSRLSIKYYDTHKDGDISSRITNDIEVISNLLTQTLPRIVSYLITFIGILVMMFTINVTLTLITVIALPLAFILSKLFMKLAKRKYKEYYEKYGYLNALVQESYYCKETISLYNNDKQIATSFNTLNKDLAKTNLKANLITILITPITSIINYLIYIIVIILGSKYVLEKKLLLGDIQALIQYTKQLSTPINSFSSLLTSIQSSLSACERVFELLDEEEETHNGTLPINNIETIEFKNVYFSYDNNPLIEDFNLTINKGEKIAIVGETGSGKSTIINLLMQFYKINKGNILINNKSIYDYALNSYYNQISLIPQNNWLFNDTIENNLKFAKFDANEQELINSCEITNSLNIINNLPLKFKELLTEENKLSEGEKQLLVISRALLKNNNLLILDEATSNVDSKTELEIQESINKITENKTTIIIAHKLSTIINADKIVVIKDGKISEIGNHKSLYKEKGEYYNFLQTL